MSARAQADDAILDFAAKKQPVSGGILQPEQVADAALFLVSDESGAITGHGTHEELLETNAGYRSLVEAFEADRGTAHQATGTTT